MDGHAVMATVGGHEQLLHRVLIEWKHSQPWSLSAVKSDQLGGPNPCLKLVLAVARTVSARCARVL